MVSIYSIVELSGGKVSLYDTNLVSFPFQFNFMGLHDLLDGGTDVTKPGVDSGGLDAHLGGLLHGFQQRVKFVVEGHSPGAVDYTALRTRGK